MTMVLDRELHHLDQEAKKKQRLDDDDDSFLVPEDVFLAQHPGRGKSERTNTGDSTSVIVRDSGLLEGKNCSRHSATRKHTTTEYGEGRPVWVF